MPGLYSVGVYYDEFGNICRGEVIDALAREDRLKRMYLKTLSIDSFGQRKLASVFTSFVSKRNVIYIGASPGSGWMLFMDEFPDVEVYCFDPAPMEATHPRVHYYDVRVIMITIMMYARVHYYDTRV